MVAQSGKISDTTTLLESLSPNSDSISRARGDVKIFIVYKGDTVQIPVNPSDLKIATPGNNKTYPIVSLGEINVLKNPKLSTIGFSCFFPTIETQNYPYVLTGNSEQTFYTALIKQILDRQNKAQFHEPSFYVSLFSKIRDSKEPIRLIITGLAVGFNKLVSIEKFDYDWKEADPDPYYDIEFKVYQIYAVNNATVDEDGTIAVDTGGLRTDESEALTMGDEVSVTGTIYKDPAMQFVDRYVKNKTGCYVNLLDFDNNGAIHITDNEDRWIGWVSETAVNKISGIL
jgi:hypothetical protein